MGQNGAVVGQVPHFGPFPFEKSAKGGPKWVENQVSACQTIPDHKISTLAFF
jgi:hypothetical protein